MVFTLLAAALEPERASRRFIADWYLRTARESLEERGADPARRRRLFSALVHEVWAYLQSSELGPERALVVGSRIERRLVGALPEYRGSGPGESGADDGSAAPGPEEAPGPAAGGSRETAPAAAPDGASPDGGGGG